MSKRLKRSPEAGRAWQLLVLAMTAWPCLAGAQETESSEDESRVVIDATAPEVWDVGALTPADLDQLERRRALLNTDDPSWSRDLGSKWALGANERLNDPLPAWDRERKEPVGLRLERRF